MEKLTVLCVPISAMGHTNATLGVATALRKRGHRVVFAAERSWEGKFVKLGFDEEIYDEKPEADEASGLQWNEFAIQLGIMLKKSPIDGYSIIVDFFDKFLEQSKYSNAQLERIVQKWKPNVIIEDRLMQMPALINSGAPLIKLFSVNPLLAFEDDRLPPACLGLPLDDSSEWQQIREMTREMREDNVRRVNEWLESIDSSIPKRDPNREYISTNLNIYMYPRAAVEDYLKLRPLDDEWMRLDFSLREAAGKFEIPEQLQNRPGKLVYFSLGSIGTSLMELMKRLVGILSKSKHRFIVSVGPCGDQYELAENMWGEPFLPQLDILPHVDLVITHGGNNTFVESLYFGKRMIVLPLFADQHDNGQRAVEMKIGYKFNPFLVEEKEMNEAIDRLLLDSKAAEIVQNISKEMQESDCMDEVVSRIEYVAKHPKFPTITGIN